MTTPRQPLLHGETVVYRAPTQVWSSADGSVGSHPIHGLYHSDVRLLAAQSITVGGEPLEHVATAAAASDDVVFVAVVRQLDDPSPDPGVRAEHRRVVTGSSVEESLVITSRLGAPVTARIVVEYAVDGTSMDAIKAGIGSTSAPAVTVDDGRARWSADGVDAVLSAPGATMTAETLAWDVEVPASGSAGVSWRYDATDARAVVEAADADDLPWAAPDLTGVEDRLARWVARSLQDLDALRLTTPRSPGNQFLAAGTPWFFTLFGRDSIWAARFLLPLGTRVAADTLRILADLQGAGDDPATAEEPGKIMHELRRAAIDLRGEGVHLPPLYYGTVDATPLWVCLLHDAWRAGLPDDEVRALLPNLRRALEWMRDHGDSDGDGLLEYVDRSGKGLSNQGWKDSGDSVQWRDGTLATGPIALCEVQAYAYEAATHGADLLDAFGDDGSEWRAWAARLRERFAAAFWVEDERGAYVAIALDADKRPVDTVTSNLGHLLGTGLLDEREAALVAARLVSPELSSGYGLRTMSTDSVGYWPLSYHGGSVWTHDTAIAISGLAKDGFQDEARQLAEGLLAAASGFDYRMPELYSGDDAARFAAPVPYPAACRPQAWAAAAAVQVLSSVTGR